MDHHGVDDRGRGSRRAVAAGAAAAGRRQRGLIAADEAEVARTEAGRRVLAAIRREGAAKADSTSRMRTRIAAAGALVLLPLISLGVYLSVGRPDLPAQPLAAREVDRGGGISMDEAVATME